VIEPQWIRLDVVLAIHAEQLAEHGGLEGLRDQGGLESAIASPRNLLAYGSPTPDIAAMGAQYAFAIACNQVFIDGNKRTALVVFRTFLLLNGHDLQASQNEKYTTMMKLANREIDAVGLADWIRTRLMPAR
jgi:death-on-curing protein